MNKRINMSGWYDYWELFDRLCDSLLARNEAKLVQQLDEARLPVRDHYESANNFLKTISRLFTRHQDQLGHEEKKMANTLVASLQRALEDL